VWQECVLDAQVTPKPLPRCHRCHRRPGSFALQRGRAARRVAIDGEWPEGEGHNKGFIAYAIVCDLTDDVARSRMRNGSTASFPDLFSTSVEPISYDQGDITS
jgi:hypothetical protein